MGAGTAVVCGRCDYADGEVGGRVAVPSGLHATVGTDGKVALICGIGQKRLPFRLVGGSPWGDVSTIRRHIVLADVRPRLRSSAQFRRRSLALAQESHRGYAIT
jgi:hypothetical protein